MASHDSAQNLGADTQCHEFMDSLVQSLFGIGLRLEGCMDSKREAQSVRNEIDQSLHALHVVIGSISEHRDVNCLRDCLSTMGTPK